MYKINASEVMLEKKIQNVCSLKTDEIKLRDDLYLYDGNTEVMQQIQVNNNINQTGFFLNFTKTGNYHYKVHNKQFFINKQNQTCISSMKNIDKTQITLDPMTHKNLGIHIKFEFLEENFPQIYEKIQKHNFLMLKNSPTLLKTQFCINEILQNQQTNEFGKIFLESKVLEIIAYELANIFEIKNQKKLYLSKFDKNAIHEANEILQAEFANPPSIKELSRRIKLNEFKLKIGFKQIYDKTPYDIVREKRMLMAKEMIKSSDLNISEISSQIGIKNSSYFTKVFYDEFKILPKDLIKTRKYY